MLLRRRDSFRCPSCGFLVVNDLLQALDAVLGEGGDSVLANAQPQRRWSPQGYVASRSITRSTKARSSGCTRLSTMSIVTLVVGSYPKIWKVSSDQKISSLVRFQPKLPVWLNLCASAR